jgi:hypothetical protein
VVTQVCFDGIQFGPNFHPCIFSVRELPAVSASELLPELNFGISLNQPIHIRTSYTFGLEILIRNHGFRRLDVEARRDRHRPSRAMGCSFDDYCWSPHHIRCLPSHHLPRSRCPSYAPGPAGTSITGQTGRRVCGVPIPLSPPWHPIELRPQR